MLHRLDVLLLGGLLVLCAAVGAVAAWVLYDESFPEGPA